MIRLIVRVGHVSAVVGDIGPSWPKSIRSTICSIGRTAFASKARSCAIWRWRSAGLLSRQGRRAERLSAAAARHRRAELRRQFQMERQHGRRPLSPRHVHVLQAHRAASEPDDVRLPGFEHDLSSQRQTSNTPLQALTTLNNEVVRRSCAGDGPARCWPSRQPATTRAAGAGAAVVHRAAAAERRSRGVRRAVGRQPAVVRRARRPKRRPLIGTPVAAPPGAVAGRSRGLGGHGADHAESRRIRDARIEASRPWNSRPPKRSATVATRLFHQRRQRPGRGWRWRRRLNDDGALAARRARPRRRTSNPLAPKAPHFAPRAKACIFIFLEGAPSQIDLFDPKPKLNELHGQKLPESMTKNVRFAFIKKDTATLLGTQAEVPEARPVRHGAVRPAAAHRHGGRRHAAGPQHAHRPVQPSSRASC